MENQIIITVLLVLVFMVELTGLINNFFVVRKNYETHRAREHDLKERISALEKENEHIMRMLREEREPHFKNALILIPGKPPMLINKDAHTLKKLLEPAEPKAKKKPVTL